MTSTDCLLPKEDVLHTDRLFFSCLASGNAQALDELLADDFVMVGITCGSEIPKAALLVVMSCGQLKFHAMEPSEVRVRLYGDTAVVTGRTQIGGQCGDDPFHADTRYTHVYVRHQDAWRMVNAQGTPIVTAQPSNVTEWLEHDAVEFWHEV